MFTAESLKDRVVPLTINDWTKIEKWLKRKPIDDAKEYSAGLSMESQTYAMKEALSLSQTISITTPEGLAILATPAGVAKLLHATLNKAEPNLTIEQVGEQLSFAELQPILSLLMEHNGFFKESAKNVPEATLSV